MPVDLKRAERLKQARANAGYETAADAARAFGWKFSTYSSHENGNRGFPVKTVALYAGVYKVSYDWLQFGTGSPRSQDERIVNLSGIVADFGVIDDRTQEDTSSMNALSLQVEVPPGFGHLTAYRVAGDMNQPAFFAGDLLFVGQPGEPGDHIGRQCLVTLAEGTRRIAVVLARGAGPGLFLLLSVNAGPVVDANVIEAAPIVWIKRG